MKQVGIKLSWKVGGDREEKEANPIFNIDQSVEKFKLLLTPTT